MRKLVTFLMVCITIGLLQVNCTVFNYFGYVRSINMCNSTIRAYVTLVKVMCHNCVICCVFITKCRKLKSMVVTFHGTASFHTRCLKNCWRDSKVETHTHTHTCACHMQPANSSALLRYYSMMKMKFNLLCDTNYRINVCRLIQSPMDRYIASA